MLAKPRQTVLRDLIEGLKRTPANDVIIHEPVLSGDLMGVVREAQVLLRTCEYLSIIVVKHK